jgi:hypothetical protein
MLTSGQKLTLGLLTTATLEVVPFSVYAHFSALPPFFKCIVEERVLLGCVASLPITSNWGGRRRPCCFWSRILWLQRKCETVRCSDAAASSVIAKVRGEVFAHFQAVAVKRHSTIWNRLLFLPGGIKFRISPLMSNDELFNACLVIAKVSVAISPRFAQNLMPIYCRISRETASGNTPLHNQHTHSTA